MDFGVKSCKRFNTTSRQARSVWLLHLQLLDYNHAPDLPPHVAANLQSMTAKEARWLTIRAVRGFYNWTSPRTPRPHSGSYTPKPTREYKVNFIPPWSTGRPTPESLVGFRAQLVAGGEFLVVNNHGLIEVTKLPRGEYVNTTPFNSPSLPRSGSGSSLLAGPQRVWRDGQAHAGDDILGFGNDIVDGGSALIVAAVTLRVVHRAPRRLYVSVKFKA